ncbi:MAG: ATP-binding cassette domain-containing protein [Candidatus Velthaea sp.]|jgi:branched-chain amino acid transport system ATP-binding protein
MISALNVDKLRLDMGEYVLSVQGLSKRVRGRQALARIDLDVKRGAFAALVGPAGAGKSLTLACIAGAAKPSRGRVRYFGYEIRGRAQERVAQMGVVRTHQTPQAFGDMTVLDSVIVGALLRNRRVGAARERAREILALIGLAGVGGRRFAQLEPLDRKRLELARALATEPQVLLLDDLAAGLDGAGIAALRSVLGALRGRGTTVVAAARTLDQLPLIADDVVAIDRGKTAEIGADAAVNFRA